MFFWYDKALIRWINYVEIVKFMFEIYWSFISVKMQWKFIISSGTNTYINYILYKISYILVPPSDTKMPVREYQNNFKEPVL